MLMTIGVLKPEEAGKRANARVAEWDAGKRRAEAKGGRAKPGPEPPATVAAAPVVARAIGDLLTPEELMALNRKLKDSLKAGDEEGALRALVAGASANIYFHRNDAMMGIPMEPNIGATVLMVAAMKG